MGGGMMRICRIFCLLGALLQGTVVSGALFTTNGNLWARVLKGHERPVFGVAFLSGNDSEYLATGCKEGVVNYWDRDGLLVDRTVRKSAVFFLSYSREAGKLYVTRQDGSLEVRVPGKKTRVISGHTNYINAVAENPDGKSFATVSEDRTVRLWSSTGGQLRLLADHKQAVTSVDYAPDGSQFATGSRDNLIKIWKKNGELLRTLQGHTDYVWSVRFTPDGKYLISVSKDRTVRVWSTRTWTTVRVLQGHAGDLWSLAVSADSRYLVTAGRSQLIYVWSLEGRLLPTLRGHREGVVVLVFSPDGKTLASGSLDGTVILWK